MMECLVNILVPTYEPNPAFLRAAIESALAQKEQRWRMLIHDDASTADVHAIVEPFLRDERITFARSDTRLGIGGNWNACVSAGTFGAKANRSSRAPYLQFLFQDDLWHPLYLTNMLRALETNPTAGFASADHKYTCDATLQYDEQYDWVRLQRQHIAPGLHDGNTLLGEWIDRELLPNIIGEPSFVLLRRSLVEQVGMFDESLPQLLDADYWLRCLQQSDWYWVNAELGAFRVHGAGASTQNQLSGVGIYDRLRCFEKLIHALPRGPLRTAATTARNRSLESMVKKFWKRLRGGRGIPGKGTGGMGRFALQHPLLILGAVVRAMVKKDI